jgi:uncharacterized Zn-binding protein involved in type VI secretion
MPPAAVQNAITSHPGTISGPGVPNVRIAGVAAAVLGDTHVCGATGHPPNAISTASAKVRVGGRFAARQGDSCTCGARIETGVAKVNIT